MKKTFPLVTFFLLFNLGFSQMETEIYLFDMDISNNGFSLANMKNISQNTGYDSQPFFTPEGMLLFSSNRGGQTDIAVYNPADETKKWLTNTPMRGEYSPMAIPESKDVAAIGLDTTGLQRLYRYNTKTQKSKEILEDATVGYQLWIDKNTLATTVLEENRMDLIVAHLGEGSTRKYQKDVGRSLLKIPGSDRFSYVSKENGQSLLKSMDPLSGATDSIISISGSEDFCWLNNGMLLTGKGTQVLGMNPTTDKDWNVLVDLKEKGIKNISRMGVNAEQNTFVLVAEPDYTFVVDRQVETYNARDLDGFASCYGQDVVVKRFPKDTLYTGRETMKTNYKQFFERTQKTSVEVLQRIAIGPYVIDKEKALVDGEITYQVAIYTLQGGEIVDMTFIFDTEVATSPEGIVRTQLEAYNNRDIDAFMATYTDDIALFNYPLRSLSTGQDAMRSGYESFFSNTPDLHCDIKTRMVIGNKVIDEEQVTVNGGGFRAVAIYEVENGKISRVTFLR
ncbi:MAG: nuclear transport factor 2 family protein [Bacteroidota bacterium]